MKTLVEQVHQCFGQARLWAAHQAPYLATAVFSLQPIVLEPNCDEETSELIPDPSFRAFPADTQWHIHLDPGTALTTPIPEIGWWLLHHIGHLVRHHAARSPVVAMSGNAHVTGDQTDLELARLWNLAADAEVNDDLATLGLPEPPGVISPQSLGLTEGRLAEEYLPEIEVLDQAHLIGGTHIADLVYCGSAADGLEAGLDSGTGAGLSQLERDLLELRIAHDIGNQSEVPGGWRRWATKKLNPMVDWRSQLRVLIRRGTYTKAGKVDFSYAKPSRRQLTGGVILPSMVAPKPKLAVVVDTSGSISTEKLSAVLAEFTSILSTFRHLNVICCDSAAHPVQVVRKITEIEFSGGGGTDMREGIAAALQLKPQVDLIVVLTDGETPWPETRPRIPTIIALVGALPDRLAKYPLPTWAHVVSTGESKNDTRSRFQ